MVSAGAGGSPGPRLEPPVLMLHGEEERREIAQRVQLPGEKGILTGPVGNARGMLASRWQRNTSPAPIPLASASLASAKPFWGNWGGGCENQ